jgi:hypothetical protein
METEGGESSGAAASQAAAEPQLSRFWRLPAWARVLVVLGVIAAILALLVALGSVQQRRDEAEREQRAAEFVEATTPSKVIYQVTGDGTYFSMTASTPDGSVQANPDLPLRTKGGEPFTFEAMPGEFLYISAQIQNGTTITCRIAVDDVVIAENTSTGSYSIATCEGSVP